MNPLLTSMLLIIAFTIFGTILYRKFALLRALEPANRTDRVWKRFKLMLSIGIGQRRFIGRKRERISGWIHALIFWGFCILTIRSLTLIGEGFQHGFHLPFLGQKSLMGYFYLLLKDVTEGIVLLAVLFAMYRRSSRVRPSRLKNSGEAWFVLALIAFLMITDLFYDGARFAIVHSLGSDSLPALFNYATFGPEYHWTPIANGIAIFLKNADPEFNRLFMHSNYWLHIVGLLLFLCYLPLGKHFHVITALPNVFLKSIDYPHEPTKLLNLEDEKAWEEATLGMNHIDQLTWKQALDLFSCTECGRCKDVCPTYVTGKPLNMKDFNDSLKKELKSKSKNIIRQAKLKKIEAKAKEEEKKESLKSERATLRESGELVGEVISEEILWSCTTCRACEEVCPVTIEHVPRIISMRQGQTLVAEKYPKELNSALKGLERNGNPWGIGYDKRADWAKDLGIKTLEENPDVEYLFWVGCFGAFDERSKKVTITTAKLLQKANVDFGILGTEEKCTGDLAKKVGHEMLYQMMAQENIELLNRYQVKKIITTCPHCLDTLKHEYPKMNGHYKVIHHSEFLLQLLRDGKLKPKRPIEETIAYHDPCYLGRYNNVYQAPRELLNSIQQNKLIEPDRHGQESFCCGAGGGLMWMEEKGETRINQERTNEIVRSQAQQIAVGCPFCLTMLEDGLKAINQEENVKVQDLSELLSRTL